MEKYNRQIELTKADIKINLNGNLISFKNPIGSDMNRYFIPINEFLSYLNSKLITYQGRIYITKGKSKVLLNENYIATYVGNITYLSLLNITKLFDLETIWDYDKRIIYLYSSAALIPRLVFNKKIAFIRLEDISAGGLYDNSEAMLKLRIIAGFMRQSGANFHIAWIPKFVDPTKNINNDISVDYNIQNADFLYTLEYLISKGGILGIHGYTHQNDNEISGVGSEFTETKNTDEIAIRHRINAAIKIADMLGLKYYFFESPHYESGGYQQGIIEQYFDRIFEPCVGCKSDRITVSPRNSKTLYIPTPLGYVDADDGIEGMLSRISKNKSLASLFFHPYLEFDYIKIKSGNKDKFSFDYLDNSPLKRIILAIYDKNYRFSKISELTAKNLIYYKHFLV